MTAPSNYLDYGALGAAILVLLVAVGVLVRILGFAREILDLVLSRIQDNTRALAVLADRLDDPEAGSARRPPEGGD